MSKLYQIGYSIDFLLIHHKYSIFNFKQSIKDSINYIITYRNSRSVIATNTGNHRSKSSELSELDWPFCCVDEMKCIELNIKFDPNNKTKDRNCNGIYFTNYHTFDLIEYISLIIICVSHKKNWLLQTDSNSSNLCSERSELLRKMVHIEMAHGALTLNNIELNEAYWL